MRRLAEIAFQVNERTENIGARRLHTVLERLLDEISFEAADQSGQHYRIDAAYVDGHLGTLVKDEDLSRYILDDLLTDGTSARFTAPARGRGRRATRGG